MAIFIATKCVTKLNVIFDGKNLLPLNIAFGGNKLYSHSIVAFKPNSNIPNYFKTMLYISFSNNINENKQIKQESCPSAGKWAASSMLGTNGRRLRPE